MKKVVLFSMLGLIGLFLLSCGKETPEVDKDQVVVRLKVEPDRLNPVLRRSIESFEIIANIFQSPADYDPETLVYEPVLLERLPEKMKAGNLTYFDFDIRETATWHDGKPVLSGDIEFTLKLIFNEFVPAGRIRSQLKMIDSVEVLGPKKCRVFVQDNIEHLRLYCTNYLVMPMHIYDPLNVMTNISFSDIKGDTSAALETYAEFLLQPEFSREKIIGSGPYTLNYWNTDYELSLEKVKNWWGENMTESALFDNNPDEIIYRVLPDDQLSGKIFTSGQLDVLPNIGSAVYDELTSKNLDYSIFHSELMRFYFLNVNNESPLLKEKKVRQAMAHLIDQRAIIDIVAKGGGQPIVSPFYSASPFYNSNLKPYAFDIEAAKELLDQAGWVDSNNNGIRDKKIDGKAVELSPRVFITAKPLGRNILDVLKPEFAKAGIELNVIVQDYRSKTIKNLKSGNFDLVASVLNQSPVIENLRSLWHSSSVSNGGNNFHRMQNPKIDSLIEVLTTDLTDEAQKVNAWAFQEEMHEHQPILYLFKPSSRIAVSRKWKARPSNFRPGYHVRSFARQ